MTRFHGQRCHDEEAKCVFWKPGQVKNLDYWSVDVFIYFAPFSCYSHLEASTCGAASRGIPNDLFTCTAFFHLTLKAT